MALHILIDGYNLIKSGSISGLDEIPDLQLQRESLLERLASYNRLKRHPISVIFDGTRAPGVLHRKERKKGIDIRFSRLNQTADTLIKTLVSRERERALVVTSDLDIARFAESMGAAVISSAEFGKRIAQAERLQAKPFDSEEDWAESGWVPTTKKKGPRKRPPKKARRALSKVDKL